jgi:CDP-diacylglycerol--serine O-phosphatidyltransferase
MLDGIDGRVTRMLKGTSRFGAELDSLADFVNFGVAPALILYFWGLHELKSAGWIAALVFAICAALRLARFNVMIDDPDRPAWAGNYFVGVPAPAGAITVLLPIYVQFLGVPHLDFLAPVAFVYTLGIAFLMVSRLPVLSGKRVGKRVAPDMVLPVFVLIVLFFALLISYPWEVLTIGTVIYLVSLPLGWFSYREAQRKSAAATAAAGDPKEASGPAAVVPAAAGSPAAVGSPAAAAAAPGGEAAPQPSPSLAAEHPPQSERPTRLN